MREKDIDIALIAEPVTILEGNWMGSNNKGAATSWSNKIKERIKVAFKEEEFVAIEVKDMILISCYISPKKGPKEFFKTLREMKNNIRERKTGCHRRGFQRSFVNLGIQI